MISVLSYPDNDNPFIVIDKPAGLPSAPLCEGEDSALTEAADQFPFIKEVKGRKAVEYGLLHRLDTATRGILVIASSQFAYERLLDSQNKGVFRKYYRAETEKIDNFDERTEGFPPLACAVSQPPVSFTIQSGFRPFGIKGCAVRPVTELSGTAALKKGGDKQYRTEVTITHSDKKNIFFADCSITAGYRHQVRCHLAWSHFPVCGDTLYNPNCIDYDGSSLKFTAYRISFPHPLTGLPVEFEIPVIFD